MKRLRIPAEHKNRIKDILETLSFVRWDRFVKDDNELWMYGWIDRKDSKKDFIVLTYRFTKRSHTVEFVTSSKLMHEAIVSLLGFKESEMIPCKRVEWYFDIPNMIRL